MSKCYVLLFTCATTRAVYLELTPDVGVYSLILAVRRFISRNSTPKLFISDNFKSFRSKDIKSYLKRVNITWKFILEKSPWWEGFYERLIGVMKNLLKNAMGRASSTYDEILTILIEIESIINSRPLTYMSDNHDEGFITPYHLIYGCHIHEKCYKYNAKNEISSDQIREDLSSKNTNVKSYFIKRFEDYYVIAIREYYNQRKFKNNKQLVIGDVVLVKEDNLPRISWRKGRIINAIKGVDKLDREAEIKVRQRHSDFG